MPLYFLLLALSSPGRPKCTAATWCVWSKGWDLNQKLWLLLLLSPHLHIWHASHVGAEILDAVGENNFRNHFQCRETLKPWIFTLFFTLWNAQISLAENYFTDADILLVMSKQYKYSIWITFCLFRKICRTHLLYNECFQNVYFFFQSNNSFDTLLLGGKILQIYIFLFWVVHVSFPPFLQLLMRIVKEYVGKKQINRKNYTLVC